MAASSEIEVVSEPPSSLPPTSVSKQQEGLPREGTDEALREDIYTAAAYGDLEKLHRLVEKEHCSVSLPDNGGFFALQWSSLNNRVATAQYIVEVRFPFPSSPSHSLFDTYICTCVLIYGTVCECVYAYDMRISLSSFVLSYSVLHVYMYIYMCINV